MSDLFVYIAGPMTGYEDWNYPAFNDAEERLRACDWNPVNPAKNHGGRTDLERRDYLRTALRQVGMVDAVALLPGWEDSGGARLEVLAAQEMGTPVYELECLLDPHFMDSDCEITVGGFMNYWQSNEHVDHTHDTTTFGEVAPPSVVEEVHYADRLAGPVEDVDPHMGCNCQAKSITTALIDSPEEPVRASVLDEAKKLITGDRNNQYGPPGQDFERTAGILTSLGYGVEDKVGGFDVLQGEDVAIIMIALKLSRLMHMSNKRDSWVDVAGYAGCGAEVAGAK